MGPTSARSRKRLTCYMKMCQGVFAKRTMQDVGTRTILNQSKLLIFDDKARSYMQKERCNMLVQEPFWINQKTCKIIFLQKKRCVHMNTCNIYQTIDSGKCQLHATHKMRKGVSQKNYDATCWHTIVTSFAYRSTNFIYSRHLRKVGPTIVGSC